MAEDQVQGISITKQPSDARGRPRGTVQAPRRLSLPLWSVLIGSLMVSVGLAFGLRALGRSVLDVPRELPSLVASALLPAAVLPVLGNCFGYFVSFRAKPSAHSMRLFLGIGAAMTLIGIAISASKLPTSASTASVAATVVVDLVPTLLTIAGLLLLVPRPRSSTRA